MFCKRPFCDFCILIAFQDSHKIVFFVHDDHGIAGTHLDPTFLEDPRRPPDALFRWHYREAVRANVKG